MNAPAFVGAQPPAVEADPAFLADALDGLSRPRKTLPAKYFYDLAGSEIFEEITRLPEYYPTRTERGILADQGPAIGALVPAGAALVEFGSGSTEKVRLLLPHLRDLFAYVPVDVSAGFLEAEAARLRADHPGLEVVPVVADFTGEIGLPGAIAGRPRAGFFPGSTVGNFEPPEAGRLLFRFGDLLGPDGLLIVGVDLVKDVAVLEAAYDDAAGVTARFNLNVLARLNRELGADLDLSAFSHRAFFDRERSRIEMHLVSERRQTAHLGGRRIDFAAGETIHTENSYKYTPESFAALAGAAGWHVERSLTDPARLFAVFVLRAR